MSPSSCCIFTVSISGTLYSSLSTVLYTLISTLISSFFGTEIYLSSPFLVIFPNVPLIWHIYFNTSLPLSDDGLSVFSTSISSFINSVFSTSFTPTNSHKEFLNALNVIGKDRRLYHPDTSASKRFIRSYAMIFLVSLSSCLGVESTVKSPNTSSYSPNCSDTRNSFPAMFFDSPDTTISNCEHSHAPKLKSSFDDRLSIISMLSDCIISSEMTKSIESESISDG